MHTICAFRRIKRTAFRNHSGNIRAASLSSWWNPYSQTALPVSPFLDLQGAMPAEGLSGSTALQRLYHCLPQSGTGTVRLLQRSLGSDSAPALSFGLRWCKRADLGLGSPHDRIRYGQPSHCLVTSAAVAQSFGRVSRLPLSEEEYAMAQVMEGKQMCDICQRSYCLRHFQVSRVTAGGRFPECRGCVYEDKQRRRHHIKGRKEGTHPPTQGPMCCSKCSITLPARFFAVDSTLQQGRRSSCLTCHSERDAARPRIYKAPAEKECSGPICNGSLQPADNFRLCRLNSTGLQSYCKKCAAAYEHQHDELARAVPYGLVM